MAGARLRSAEAACAKHASQPSQCTQWHHRLNNAILWHRAPEHATEHVCVPRATCSSNSHPGDLRAGEAPRVLGRGHGRHARAALLRALGAGCVARRWIELQVEGLPAGRAVPAARVPEGGAGVSGRRGRGGGKSWNGRVRAARRPARVARGACPQHGVFACGLCSCVALDAAP